jgi:uncharacterized protein (TIGR00251 family)
VNHTKEAWVEFVIPNKKFRLRVYAKPNAKTEKIEIEPNYIVISIQSAPEKGKANKEIIEILSETLNINSSKFTLVSGQKSRDKIIEIDCPDGYILNENEIKRRLLSK